MKNIIKKLEKAVEESKATLQKVKPKKKHMRNKSGKIIKAIKE